MTEPAGKDPAPPPLRSRVLTRLDLDSLAVSGCAVPGCKHKHESRLFLRARCHMGARLTAAYATDGTLTLYCGECERPVACVLVAAFASGASQAPAHGAG